MFTLLYNAIRLAFGAIARNKLRAALTVLGMLIGTASVVVVTSLAGSAQDQIVGQFDSFGSNLIYVNPAQVIASGAHSKATGRLTDNDALAIERESVSVAGAAPFSSTNAQVVFEDKNVNTMIAGTTLSYLPARKWVISKGKSWTESDEQIKTKVCLIGATAAKNLFGEKDPVGRTVRIGRAPFIVIGVLEARGSGGFGGGNQDDRILMPIGSFRARVKPSAPGHTDMILVSAAKRETTNRALDQVTAILKQRHHIMADAPDDFELRTQAEFRDMIGKIVTNLRKLLFAVATVSLLVGGIGVMNIMLVSVTERTREIGIRLSIGAREGDILVQFLTEAVILSLIGGAFGIAAGVGLTGIASSVMGQSMNPGPEAMLIAASTSAAIGLIFGFLPARRAAQLDPIEALRVD